MMGFGPVELVLFWGGVLTFAIGFVGFVPWYLTH